MYRFPLWKHLLVLTVLVVAVLFALPNAFGEDPALQLSRDDRAAMDDASQQRVLGILSAASIPVAASHIEDDRLVIRFPLVDEQLKARDAILDASGSDFLVALTNAPRTPALLRNLGFRPMSLGLDLRGGVYFMYEVDVQGAVRQLLDRLDRDYRTLLRDQRIPYTNIAVDGNTLRVVLRQATDVPAAIKSMQGQDTTLTVSRDNAAAEPTILVQLTPEQVKLRQDFAIQQNIMTMRNRVNELGVAEADRGAPGRRPHRHPAAGHAGSERGHPRARRDRHAGVPARRRGERSVRGRAHQAGAARHQALPAP